MKVWVVECGVYAESYVDGVYRTLALAAKAHPITQRMIGCWPNAGWNELRDGTWDNGCDMADYVKVTEYEVEGGEPDVGAGR